MQGDRHPADVVAVGVADRERIDVEVARAHQARHAVQDARLVEDDRDEDVAAGLAAARQRARRRGAVGRWRRCGRRRGAASRPAAGRSTPGRRSFVRPAPLLDQVGQALAGRHHREDVLLLGDLEPDERRAVDRLGGADRVVDLVRRARPEGRDPERVGELGEVRARAGWPSGSCRRR